MPHSDARTRTLPTTGPVRTRASFTIREAVEGAPVLALLAARIADSRQRLDAIRPLIPPALRAEVRAGPIDDTGWRILAPHNAAAAKLRQLEPAFRAALEQAHLPVESITIKVRGR